MMCIYFFIAWPRLHYLKLPALTLSIFLEGYEKNQDKEGHRDSEHDDLGFGRIRFLVGHDYTSFPNIDMAMMNIIILLFFLHMN